MLAAFMMLPSIVSAQQNLRSGYFLDGYIYKYKMNPAMAPERGFFAMPLLGNLSMAAETNLGISTFLYPTESGTLTTFLSPRVSNEEFMSKISNNNKLNMNVDMSLLALGFRTGNMFHTIDLSVRADGGANVPGDFFEFMKVGGSLGKTSWDISNIGLNASARAELAYGLSRSFGDALRVGARAKLLLGLLNLDVSMDKVLLEMGADKWSVETNGNMMVSAPFTFNTRDNGAIDLLTFDDSHVIERLMDPSIGFALDLGATYDFLDYFTASFSVLDLGFMSWKHTMTAAPRENGVYFEGFDLNEFSEIDDQLNEMMSDLAGAFSFWPNESGITKTSSLSATLNAGIEARMPFYERLSFGMLYTQKIHGAYSWSEARFAANLAPTNWFSMTTNYAVSNFGHSWGGALNLHLPGFGIFVGLDSFAPLFNVTPQFIPIDSMNTNLAFGINFAFGKYHGRFAK